MAEERHANPWSLPGEQTSAARQRALESRLDQIAAEISRLRREREEAIGEFRAFTGQQSPGPLDADAPAKEGSVRVGRVPRVIRGQGALETYAAELADRGSRTSSTFGLLDGRESQPWIDRPRRSSVHRRSRPALRLVVSALLLVAGAAGSAVTVRRWTREEPTRDTREAVPPKTQNATTRTDDADALPAAGAVGAVPPAPVGTSGQARSRPLMLELTTIREAWIRTVVDDQPAAGRLLPAGETLSLEADRYVEVRLGDAGAVILRLNGEIRGPLGRDGEVLTRRFEAERDRPEP